MSSQVMLREIKLSDLTSECSYLYVPSDFKCPRQKIKLTAIQEKDNRSDFLLKICF